MKNIYTKQEIKKRFGLWLFLILILVFCMGYIGASFDNRYLLNDCYEAVSDCENDYIGNDTFKGEKIYFYQEILLNGSLSEHITLGVD